ncbi:hypothetical protein QTN47_25210 [Danxiaibacter flavus]|uniref:Uncharacterized protein n=1 Tax=Danxiaibacter flavus TaxID=3049108 RepID=A0ABV3ZLY1_9BACT|nr:hypothetical protein QNM32_25215 [Chitinophagaceae bacterium DXS]
MSPEQQSENSPGKIRIQYLQFKDIEDDIKPPPPNLVSKFKTLQDWLLDICNSNKPKKSIIKFKFELFESANDYTIVLAGVNTYDEGKNRSVTRIEYRPRNMYFKLQETYYVGLDRQQLLDKLTAELKDFSNTEKFRNSFFTKARIVVFETNGQTVWSAQ